MISTPILAAIPFLPGVGMPELLIVLVVVLLLFGPKRLPQLGKSLGKTMKAIREGAEGKLGEEDKEDEGVEASAEKVESKVTKKDDTEA